ncbi:MAG TPA: winged helix-turn-helix domain-containing protein [Pyrinomonadaceae bacterium]|nr:winged helix-turn-helix domain-containing protein [Pyrinomonadaceae bacterium]
MNIDYSHKFYEFECFSIDVQRSLLLRDGVPIRLTPKVFDTLLGLVRSGGKVMGKAELMEQIWPDSFVEESNLAQNIFLLRRLFGEHKHENRYIITVPGVGYRFAPRVKISLFASGKSEIRKEGQPVQAIAVMPFRSLNNDLDRALGLGIADALITRLSRVKTIRVLPTQSVMSLGEAATQQTLGVDAVLNGVYQRDGDQIRVSAQLNCVDDGATLWAEKFDLKFTSLFAVQDSVSEAITKALVLKLGVQARSHLSMVANNGTSDMRRCS